MGCVTSRQELLRLIDSFVEGSIDNIQFAEALSSLDVSDDPAVEEIVLTIQCDLLIEDPFKPKPWRWHYGGEEWEAIQRIRMFLQTQYPMQERLPSPPYGCLGFPVDLLVRVMTLGRRRYMPFVEWERERDDRDSYWPFPSRECYEETKGLGIE